MPFFFPLTSHLCFLSKTGLFLLHFLHLLKLSFLISFSLFQCLSISEPSSHLLSFLYSFLPSSYYPPVSILFCPFCLFKCSLLLSYSLFLFCLLIIFWLFSYLFFFPPTHFLSFSSLPPSFLAPSFPPFLLLHDFLFFLTCHPLFHFLLFILNF